MSDTLKGVKKVKGNFTLIIVALALAAGATIGIKVDDHFEAYEEARKDVTTLESTVAEQHEKIGTLENQLRELSKSPSPTQAK